MLIKFLENNHSLPHSYQIIFNFHLLMLYLVLIIFGKKNSFNSYISCNYLQNSFDLFYMLSMYLKRSPDMVGAISA